MMAWLKDRYRFKEVSPQSRIARDLGIYDEDFEDLLVFAFGRLGLVLPTTKAPLHIPIQEKAMTVSMLANWLCEMESVRKV